MELTEKERIEVAEILTRRANDIATFKGQYAEDMDYARGSNKPYIPGSVELALTREITRLRKLAEKVNPPKQEE